MTRNKNCERMMEMRIKTRESEIAKQNGIKVAEVRSEEKLINELMDRLYEHAQKVKDAISLASKAKLREEISAVECCYAFYWKKNDPEFMKKLNECKEIHQQMKVPENHWYTYKRYSA